MAPTEETILRSFLLQKAGIRDVLTLSEFSTYFPSSKRSSPLVRQLFRDIQTQRNVVCESALKQINLECRMGDNMIAKKRAEREATAAESGGRETEIDSAVIPILIATDRTRYLRGLKSIQRSD
jgi:centromere-localized protein 2